MCIDSDRTNKPRTLAGCLQVAATCEFGLPINDEIGVLHKKILYTEITGNHCATELQDDFAAANEASYCCQV